MEILVKKISTKEEASSLIKVVKNLIEYYKAEIGDTMDYKLTLLHDSRVEKFLVQNVSDDPHCYFCLLLFSGKSYGFWLVEEGFENKTLEISISGQFNRLKMLGTDTRNFKQLIEEAL